MLILNHHRAHACALFNNGRVFCWGAYSSSSGQVGTNFSVYPSVATGAATCLPVSSAPFISFSDNSVKIVQLSTGREHTCVLFVNGKVICFGENMEGQLGINSTGDISGAELPTQPYISFSSGSKSVYSMDGGRSHTCVHRCDGAILCFGGNIGGALGMGSSTLNYGDSGSEMQNISPIAFDPVKISAVVPNCGASIVSVVESSGKLTGFSTSITTYIFTVTSTMATLKFTSITTSPAIVNLSIYLSSAIQYPGAMSSSLTPPKYSIGQDIPLTSSNVNRVFKYIYIFLLAFISFHFFFEKKSDYK